MNNPTTYIAVVSGLTVAVILLVLAVRRLRRELGETEQRATSAEELIGVLEGSMDYIQRSAYTIETLTPIERARALAFEVERNNRVLGLRAAYDKYKNIPPEKFAQRYGGR